MKAHARFRTLGALLLLLVTASPAAFGQVVDAGEGGFTIRETASLSVPPSKAYSAMLEVGKWWGSDHTYSGDAANLSIDAKAQGCWCERLPGGGAVAHMTVVFVSPGKSVRMTGGLGPLQSMAVAGSMEWKFDAAEKGTKVELRYVVGGYNPGGFKEIAGGVESVLRSQFERYKRYAETGKP